jgi:hypothetical protein
MVVHLEGWADGNQAVFNTHKEKILALADIFEKHNAKISFESKEFTEGVIKWNDTVLEDLQNRGHSIGVHADVGGDSNLDYTYDDMVAELKDKKEKLESTGVSVHEVSGICSQNIDWVGAAAEAGYEFTSGLVAYCAMSLPVEERPEEHRFCSGPVECHDPYPTELQNRLSPWQANSAVNWIQNDPDGKLGIVPAGGGLYYMDGKDNEIFTEADISAAINELELAIDMSEAGKVNTYHWTISFGQSPDLEKIDEFLSRVDEYVVEGKVEWKTLPEMYDAYLEQESK